MTAPKSPARFIAAPLSGGIDTRREAHDLPPSRTPDASNVTFQEGTSSKRGGFTPLILDSVPGVGVANRGFHGKTQIRDAVDPIGNPAPFPEVPTIFAPGRMLAGHREHYEALKSGYTAKFYCSPSDLTEMHGGNGGDEYPNNQWASQTPNASGGYRIHIRPLLSKGFSKNSESIYNSFDCGDFGPPMRHGGNSHQGSIHWNAVSAFGPDPKWHEITGSSGTTGLVTITTARAHGMSNTDNVRFSATTTHDGVYVISNVTANTFDVTLPASGTFTNGVVFEEPSTKDKKHGVPLAVYLKWDGTEFRFAFGFHIIDGTDFEYAEAVDVSTKVRIGAKYQVIASYNPAEDSTLRVGTWDEETQRFVYPASDAVVTTVNDLDTGALTLCEVNQGPIQVFDMPAALIGLATPDRVFWDPATFLSVPPGLGLNHFVNSANFEGTIDEITIYSTAKGAANATAFDDVIAIDPSTTSDLLSFWSMTDAGERYLPEVTGRGNHLYMCPDTPVYDGHSGGVREGEGSLWFDGATSYIAVDTNGSNNWGSRPVGRYRDQLEYTNFHADENVRERQLAMLHKAMRASEAGAGFGISAAFWCDAFQQFEQVIAEIHMTMRIAIRSDGRIAVYVRDDADNTAPASSAYHMPVVSLDPIKLGTRYEIVGWKEGADTKLYIGGVLHVTYTGVAIAASATTKGTQAIGGMSIGAGSRLAQTVTDTPSPQVNGQPVREDDGKKLTPQDLLFIDSRSHFIGRIEKISVVVGSPTSSAIYEDPNEETGIIYDSILWNPEFVALKTRLEQELVINEQPPELTTGYAATSDAPPTGLSFLDLTRNTDLSPAVVSAEDGGVFRNPRSTTLPWTPPVSGMRFRFLHEVCRFVLSKPDATRISAGRWILDLEYSFFTTPAKRATYQFRSEIVDEMGATGGLLMRCGAPLRISETDQAAAATVAMEDDDPAAQQRGRPDSFRGPREIGCRFGSGLSQARAGTHPVTCIQDWEDSATGENVIVVGGERALYTAEPFWVADSPFDVASPMCVRSLGQDRGFVLVKTTVPAESIVPFELEVGQATPSTITTVAVEFWVKPYDLTGEQILVFKGEPGITTVVQKVNWAIYLRDGMIGVTGEGAASVAWAYEQRTYSGSGGVSEGGHSALRANEWNHVHVLMGDVGTPTTEVVAWVNGVQIVLVQRFGANALAANTGAVGRQLYLMGLPGNVPLVFKTTALPDHAALPFRGQMSGFAQWNTPHADFLSAAVTHAPVPRAFRTADANTQLLFNFDNGSGREIAGDPDTAPITPRAATIEIPDLLEIAEDVYGSSTRKMESVVYRDRAYLTNGLNVPLEIVRDRRTAPNKGFDVRPMGLPIPAVPEDVFIRAVTDGPKHPNPLSSTSYLAAGAYNYFMSYFDADNRESEPVLLGSITTVDLNEASGYQITDVLVGSFAPYNTLVPPNTKVARLVISGFPSLTGSVVPNYVTIKIVNMPAPNTAMNGFWAAEVVAAGLDVILPAAATPAAGLTVDFEVYFDGVQITGLPRAESAPHVVGRRFYVSAFGGGTDVWHSDLRDNESTTVELWGPGGVFGESPFVRVNGLKLPPPRARMISAGPGLGAIVLMHLTDTAAGANALAWSDGAEPTYFTLSTQTPLDSVNSRAIVGGTSHRGVFYIFKRDSTWMLNLRSITSSLDIGSLLRQLNASVGLGGGLVSFDDRLFGASEFGVHRFDGSNQQYISKSLKELWQQQPLEDEDLIRATGAFYPKESLYMLSFRATRTAKGNTVCFVTHTSLQSEDGYHPIAPWTVPEHLIMAKVVDPVRSEPALLLGTTSGRLLRYDPDAQRDCALADGTLAKGSLLDTALLTPTILNVAATGIQRDLHGATIHFTITVGGVKTQTTRTIERHWIAAWPLFVGLIYWRGDLPTPDPATQIDIQIGGYDGYQTTPWVKSDVPGVYLTMDDIDMEFSPSPATMALRTAGAMTIKDVAVADVASTRAFPTNYKEQVFDMTDGYTADAIPVKDGRGRYVRALFGTLLENEFGVDAPFSVSRLAIRYTEGGRRGRPN